MIYKLTKFKRDKWVGVTRLTNTFVQLGPELGKDGHPVTGLDQKTARRLEKALFMPEGQLDKRNAYWQDTFFVPFPEGGLTLNDEDPEQELHILFLKAQKIVAVGQSDLKKKSKAEYMLTSVEMVVDEEDDRLSVKEQAYEHLINSTPTSRKQIYVVLQASRQKGSKIIDADSMTDKAIKNELRTIIEGAPKSFTMIAEDDKLNIKYNILNLVTKNVLATSNGGYSFESEQIAYDLDNMVEYMENPHNQPKVIRFNQILSGKAPKVFKAAKVKVHREEAGLVEVEENEVSPD